MALLQTSIISTGPECAQKRGHSHTTAPHLTADTHPHRMGSKKNKVRKVFAPTSPPTIDANAHAINDNPTADDDDEHLVDDLLTQLDSRDQSVRRESATVLGEVRARQAAQASPPDKAGGNGSGKVRFKARQVRPRFATPAPATMTCLSSRQGKPQRSLNSSRPSMPTPMRSSSGRLRRRSAPSTRCATSWGSRCTR